MEQGTLFVKLESAREALPVQGRVVISQTVNGVRVLEIELVTDEDGLTQPVTLDAPDRSISLDPASTQQAPGKLRVGAVPLVQRPGYLV